MTMKAVGSIEAQTRSRLATIPVDALLVDVARLLTTRQVDLVVVCEADGTMAGVITKTGVVERIASCAGSACTTRAAAVMSKDVMSCRQQDDLSDVLALMRCRGFVRLPVVDADSRPVGVLIARDALKALLAEEAYQGSLLRDYVMGIGYH